MPFPIVRQHDAAQVRMIAEAHAEQVENLALVPVSGAPYVGDGVDLRVFSAQAAARSRWLRSSMQIDDLEPPSGGRGHVLQHDCCCSRT
jgi:hypothetical protein